jgi:hypothetical protein
MGAADKRWTAATSSKCRLDVSHNLGGTEYTPMQAKRRSPNLSTQKKELKLSRHGPMSILRNMDSSAQWRPIAYEADGVNRVVLGE